jgi:hypothetical protein
MAGVVAAAVVGSAAIGYMASQKASSAQQSAANRATDVAGQTAASQIELQREIFDRQTELQKPFREAGLAGQNRLMQLLGISTKPTAPGADASQEEKDQYAKELADYNALVGAKDYGKYATAEFGADKFKTDPGYAFRMSEGMKALERSAAARGGLMSGATLKGIQRYGQDLASTEFTNAFNRYQAERTGTLNPFQALAGTAQSGANTLGSQAGQMGANISNALGAYGSAAQGNIIGSGNAQASGYMGGANAIAGGVGQGINFYQNQQFMNRMLPGGSSPAPVFDYSTPYGG